METGTDSTVTAVLLIAHGSRRAAANADLLHLVDAVKQRSAYEIVEPAYLELTEPSIPQGAAACVAAGAKTVLMLPYFLSAGTHVAQDLVDFRDQFHTEFPHVKFQVCEPLGLHPLIVDVLLDRLQQAT